MSSNWFTPLYPFGLTISSFCSLCRSINLSWTIMVSVFASPSTYLPYTPFQPPPTLCQPPPFWFSRTHVTTDHTYREVRMRKNWSIYDLWCYWMHAILIIKFSPPRAHAHQHRIGNSRSRQEMLVDSLIPYNSYYSWTNGACLHVFQWL